MCGLLRFLTKARNDNKIKARNDRKNKICNDKKIKFAMTRKIKFSDDGIIKNICNDKL